jgi:hypothetical protein
MKLQMLAHAGAVSLFLVPAFCQGPTVTGDIYLQSGTAASTNFGALANLLVGPGTGATQNRGLIRFDLSGLSGVPASTVQKAMVWVYVNRVTVAGAIDVYDVTSSWQEGVATWNLPPTVGAFQGTIQTPTPGQWAGVDITTEVRGWLATPATNYGLMLQAFTAPATNVALDAKENTATSHPAQLQIVLNGPAGATGPAGPQGATGETGPMGPSGVSGPAAGGFTVVTSSISFFTCDIPEGCVNVDLTVLATCPANMTRVAVLQCKEDTVTMPASFVPLHPHDLSRAGCRYQGDQKFGFTIAMAARILCAPFSLGGF